MSETAKKLLLFPFNGNAMEAASVVEAINRREKTWNLLGFIDDDPAKQGMSFAGYRVLGGREQFSRLKDAMVLAVPGRPENYLQRRDVIASLGLKPERFATIIHPAASLGLACTVGVGSLLMANVVLTAGVKVGEHVVVLANTVIAHDSSIGAYSLVGSGVVISGGVQVEENCYLGSGSRFIQEISVGARSLVGLGAVVLAPVAPDSVVAGVPARNIREER